MTTVRPFAVSSSMRSKMIERDVMSSPVIGSSSRSTPVSWATPCATNTRWRWPPDSSWSWRSAKSATSRRSSAVSTAALSSARKRPSSPRDGYLASDTVSRTVMGRLRSTSVDCKTSAGGLPLTAAVPETASIVPARTPSNVDFPEPFGPMIASDEASGSSMETSQRACVSP